MITDLLFRLRAMLRRSAMERELDAELRFRLERETEKLVQSGLSPDDATRQARLAFGGIERIKDDARDSRGVAWLDVMTQNLRYAVRGLRAKPGFTAAVVLTLGLGIGANGAMFGIVDRLLFRSPEYLVDADHVHRVYLRWTASEGDRVERNTQFPRYLDLMRLTRAFSTFTAFATRRQAV